MTYKVLITGASSGFGKLISQTLIDKGHHVIASMRGVDSKNSQAATEMQKLGATVVDIDVTDGQSVEKGVKEAISKSGQIDVLINNAGVGVLGLQESFTIDDWRNLFEINLFGVQRVNRAILPHMRQRRSGLLMHISSILGRFVLPYFGPYNASKWALEAMADNYRVELSGLGIESILVEPGGFGTDFARNIQQASDSDCTAAYGDFANGPKQMMSSFEQNMTGENAPNPQMVADAVLKLIEQPAGQRPFRTVVDGMGMGQHFKSYNQSHQQITESIYNSMGMGQMLKLNNS